MIASAPSSHAFGAFVVHVPQALPNLPPAAAESPENRIDLDWAASGAPHGIPWAHHWTDGDLVLLSLARQDGGYWLRVPDQADFKVQLEPCTVQVAPIAPTLDGHTLEHLLVDQILPRVLAQLGGNLIHASTVRIGQRHVLFLGPSGWGKSTLAGLLYRAGHQVLSDDCVQLVARPDGRFDAVPTYPSLRLGTDSLAAVFPERIDTAPMASYSNKRRVRMPAPERGPAPAIVDAVYLLGDPAAATDEVRITAISPATVCVSLIKHSFRLDPTDRVASARQLQQCSGIARAIPGFRLDYPRDHARHAELLGALLGHVGALSASPALPDPT